MNASPTHIIGWREWIGLPQLGVKSVKAKVDTGARTSAIHAFDMEFFEEQGKPRVRFTIHPEQHNDHLVIAAEADLLEWRDIRSSNGELARRPVIVTSMAIFGETFPIELTLANRDQMGFRMLLGRQALRRRFLVDSSGSFLAGHRKKSRRGT